MTTINPWINFNGNAEEAFTFYTSVFGGEFTIVSRFKDVFTGEHAVAESEANKIMRIILPIGNCMLIANDVPESLGRVNERENRSKLAIKADSKEEADRLFKGLSVDGEVEMPGSEGEGGAYFAMFRDKYGIEWIIECDPQ